MNALLEKLALLGKESYPRVSHLETVIGRLFVDIDSFAESTMSVFRPPSPPFFLVEHGAARLRLAEHAPVTFGRSLSSRIVLAASTTSREVGEIRLSAGGVELVPRPGAVPAVRIAGREISGVVALAAGDEIAVGDDVLRIAQHPGWVQDARFSEQVISVSASLEWDMYHDSPHKPVDRSLSSFALVLAIDASVVVDALAAFGPGRRLAGGERALHPFYVRSAPVGTLVEWSREVPERALERVDGRARARLVQDLMQSLTRLRTLEAIAELVEARREGAGIFDSKVDTIGVEAGGVAIVALRVHFRPAIDARDFCAMAGWKGASAQTHDVHMSSWEISIGDRSPRIGGWIVNATLNGWPKRADGAEREAASEYDLEEHTSEVEWLTIRAPRDYDR